jgi:vancomycin resistance protein VanJ
MLSLTTKSTPARPPSFGKLSIWATTAFALAVSIPIFVIAGLVFGPGERWWVTTIALFGPAWLLQIPLGVAICAWLVFHRGKALGVCLLLAQLVLQLLVLDLVVPWRSSSAPPSAAGLRVVTWNMDGKPLSVETARRLLSQENADVIVLQECGGLPSQELDDAPHRHENLAMCLLSRFPLVEVADRDRQDVWQAGGSGAIVRYTLAAPWGQFTLTNVHLETPRRGFEAFFDGSVDTGISSLTQANDQRYTEAKLAYEWTHRGAHLPRLVAGDFNTPAHSDLLRDTWPEYTNCFSERGSGYGRTKKTRLLGVRIDHVLASSEWSCTSATTLDGFESDHKPMLAHVQLVLE